MRLPKSHADNNLQIVWEEERTWENTDLGGRHCCIRNGASVKGRAVHNGQTYYLSAGAFCDHYPNIQAGERESCVYQTSCISRKGYGKDSIIPYSHGVAYGESAQELKDSLERYFRTYVG